MITCYNSNKWFWFWNDSDSWI